MENVSSVHAKLNFPQEHIRYHRALTENPVISSSTPSSTLTLLPALFNVLHPLSRAPWYAFKNLGWHPNIVNYQKLNKVTEIPQTAIPRVDKVLDTLGGGSAFSVFDICLRLTQLTIQPDTISLTTFCTPTVMVSHSLRCPAWFVSVTRLVKSGLDNIRMYLDAVGLGR